mgnify:CR=1 FL=1
MPVLMLCSNLLLPLAAASDDSRKYVFAHYMVCCPAAGGGATVEDYQRDIQEAQRRGLDGFALNCGGWTAKEPHYKARTLLLYEAAKQLGTDFKLFLSADYCCGLSLDETADMIRTFQDHPNQFRYQGKPVLSTFSGAGADNTQGRALIDFLNREFPDGHGGRNVVFVPFFYPRPNITELPTQTHVDQVFDTFPDLDGFFLFGAAGTGEALAQCNALAAQKWRGAGKLYMAGLTPFYRGLGGNYRVFETKGFGALRAEWLAAIENDANWVEIVTWNDWGEASYVGPCEANLWGGNWGTLPSHVGYLDASRYYLDWFKHGAPPAIERDSLYYFYRPHSKDLQGRRKPKEDFPERPSGADRLIDAVWVTCYLTAPATLTMTCGEATETRELVAGPNDLQLPCALGTPRFVLMREGKVVLERTGELAIGTDTSTNFNYFAGGGAAE